MKKDLTAKQTAFIDYYTDINSVTVNNGYQSAIKAGYAHNTANNADKLILGNIGVKTAISKKIAKRQENMEYSYQEAALLLKQIIANLEPKAIKNDIAANQVIIAAARELNDISGLHKQRFVDETIEKDEIAAIEKEELRRIAAVRLAETG